MVTSITPDAGPALDPLVLSSEASIRQVVREELARFGERFGELAPPATATVEKAAAYLSIGETTLRELLAAHPEFRVTIGTRHLVKLRLLSEWLERQTSIPSSTRSRRLGRRKTA